MIELNSLAPTTIEPSEAQKKITAMTVDEYMKLPLETRQNTSKMILESTEKRYYGKVPVILLKHPKSKLKQIPTFRIITNINGTVLDILQALRQHLLNEASHSFTMFTYHNKEMLRVLERISDIYDRHKSEDGFLYLMYAEQESFGQN